jgi:hypothetical protein
MRPMPVSFDKLKPEGTDPIQEVLEHVHKAILAMPEFTLMDGTRARVTDLAPFQENAGGGLQYGFDIRLDNGAHVQFCFDQP